MENPEHFNNSQYVFLKVRRLSFSLDKINMMRIAQRLKVTLFEAESMYGKSRDVVAASVQNESNIVDENWIKRILT